MKIKLLLCSMLVLLLALPLSAAPPKVKGGSGGTFSVSTDNTTVIDVNRILMFVTNHGNFGRDLSDRFGYDYGTWYPYEGSLEDVNNNVNSAGDKSPNYASGIWIGGKVGADTRVAISEYASEFVPGPMFNETFQTDAPEFKVYKLYSDSLKANPGGDYQDYIDFAIDQGAPFWEADFYKVDSSVSPWDSTLVGEQGEPKMTGDQMLWTVYNDAGDHDEMLTDPLGVEIKQTIFGYNRSDPLGDIVFVRYRVFNNGPNTIDSFFISLWADPDLGGSGDDLVGCDTVENIGFVYNDNNNDQNYGSRPPAMGFDFFQGPLVVKTDPGQPDGKMWGQIYSDSTNLGMASFNKYINGTDPDNFTEVYDYMKGTDAKDGGAPYIYNGDTLLWQHTGDPVLGTGDIDIAPADRRFMQSTGPITFAPGDSTEILAAIVMGQGGDRKSSISVMKYNDQFAQGAYDVNFNVAKPPASPVVETQFLDNMISLRWGYESEEDPGDYPFQGYTVYQGAFVEGVLEWQSVANFDVVDGEALILDKVLDPLTGALETRGVKFGSDNGLKRFFFADEDFINGGELNNYSTYFYKVEAYSLSDDVNSKPRTLTSPAPTIAIEPGEPNAGYTYGEEGASDLEVTKVSGLSDGVVAVTIVDPTALTGDDYRVVFVDTVGLKVDTIPDPEHPEDTTFISYDIGWHLDNVTTGERLLEYQDNQTGDFEYEYTEGFVVKVTGPPIPGVKSGDAGADDEGWRIPQGARRFTWASADGYGFEGFHGALGWGNPGVLFGTHGVLVPASALKTVQLRLATVDVDGVFDVNDENVSYAYRYIRGPGVGAQPEFDAHIVDPNAASYGFQDYVQSCPISAWNMDTEPPTRLALGYLENNADYAVLDGKYWPRSYLDFGDPAIVPVAGESNTSGDGPREWLFVFNTPYTDATPNALQQGNALFDPMDIMYFMTVNRRGYVPFSPGGTGEDVFEIIPAKINAPADTFTFTPRAVSYAASEASLDAIKAFPNPFYLNSASDPSPGQYQLTFTHLPDVCTISIYNLAGEIVETIDKDNVGSPSATWDLLTSNGLPVASGMYIYVVDAPGFGQKIGKMAIFVEKEVLKIY